MVYSDLNFATIGNDIYINGKKIEIQSSSSTKEIQDKFTAIGKFLEKFGLNNKLKNDKEIKNETSLSL